MDDDQSISRRDALKKAAVVGAVVWSVPAIQTLTAAPAWAASLLNCRKFRIVPGDNGSCVVVNPQNSCLPDQTLPNDCSPIATAGGGLDPIDTPTDGTWKVCLKPGCKVQGVGLFTSNACSFSAADPNDPSGNTGLPVSNAVWTWVGWTVDADGCLIVPRPIRKSNGNPINISHIDVVVCCSF